MESDFHTTPNAASTAMPMRAGTMGLNCRLVAGSRVIEELLGAHPNRGTRRASAHAGRAAGEILAHVALHGLLRDVLRLGPGFHPGFGAESQHEPRPEARTLALRIHDRELDHAIRAVSLAVAAADAGIVDEDLALVGAMDGIGRAVLHAMGMLAVAARRRHVDLGERRA